MSNPRTNLRNRLGTILPNNYVMDGVVVVLVCDLCEHLCDPQGDLDDDGDCAGPRPCPALAWSRKADAWEQGDPDVGKAVAAAKVAGKTVVVVDGYQSR